MERAREKYNARCKEKEAATAAKPIGLTGKDLEKVSLHPCIAPSNKVVASMKPR